MCRICENNPIGSMFNFDNYEGECGICTNKVKMDLKNAVWIRNQADKNGFLNHVFDTTWRCGSCGSLCNIGFLCDGIIADGIFVHKSEYIKG